MVRNQGSLLVFTFAALLTEFFLVETTVAQVVQLPSFRVFNVRTVVSVPDGGAIQLGGVNRHFSGRVSRGIPGLQSVPGSGRLSGNRAINRNSNLGKATVHPRLIVMSELEANVLVEAEKIERERDARDPNGSTIVQERADFLTRNIGRSGRRR